MRLLAFAILSGVLFGLDYIAPEREAHRLREVAKVGVTNTHNHLEIARAAELRVPIVQGQQEYGLVASYLARAFGTSWFTPARCR